MNILNVLNVDMQYEMVATCDLRHFESIKTVLFKHLLIKHETRWICLRHHLNVAHSVNLHIDLA